MRSISRSAVLLVLAFLSVAKGARTLSETWPIKTVDLTNGGDDCDLSTQQYLMLEGHDYYDHPKFTLRWRQITGTCGEAIDGSDPMSFEASYDGSTHDAEDDPPTAGNQGRVQLNMYVCSPFGEYEIDLDVESYQNYNEESDAFDVSPPRTSWTIRNGPDEHEIWRTVYSGSENDESRLSPRVPGDYTWPLEGATGYYGSIFAGPLPPLECGSTVPSGWLLVGCFTDSKTNRLLNRESLVRDTRGPDGMTAKICSEYCGGFDYFGLEFGSECFCGNAEDLEDNNGMSNQCGLSISTLCTGDPTTACGGRDAIRVYKREKYSEIGCFQDDKASRIMEFRGWAAVMSAELSPIEADKMCNADDFSPWDILTTARYGHLAIQQICNGLCNNGVNKYFGTQYANECWCAVDADVIKNGDELESDECDMLCAGITHGEYCGGRHKITAYEMEQLFTSTYIGCYADAPVRAMNAAGKHVTGDMTNEVCISYCAEKGHAYAGTQYAHECWCGDSYDMYGELSSSSCSSRCEGNAYYTCGGEYALSVWSTD